MTGQRRLIVMRHAKAGELPGGPDAERALRPRGCRNATSAGQWLAAQGFVPDLVLCSHATRARQTWQYVSAQLPGPPPVVSDPALYQADASGLLDIFGQTQPEVGTLMYVGHNPAAADLAELLAGEPADFPTAAIAVIELAPAWPDLAISGAGSGELVASWTPRTDAG